MPDPAPEEFNEDLESYLDDARTANSEASLGHYFLMFVQNTFSTLQSNQAHRMLPELEEYVRTPEATVAIGGRIDAHMGNVLLEFKTDIESDLDDAKSQLQRYITAIWENQGRDQKYYLVASDGVRCLVYVPKIGDEDALNMENVSLRKDDEIDLGQDDEGGVFRKLDQYLLYRDDIPATAENIVMDFGPQSPVCREGLKLLHQEWDELREKNVQVLFDEWQRYLEIVHGDSDQPETLFIRHTYLSTIAKLLAYIKYGDGDLPDDDEIGQVITGETFQRLGIRNFIEEDFFSWIARDEAEGAEKRIGTHLMARLRDYDFTDINEDVLKALYQNLVTPGERHSLGEYYTPDWLCERMVEEELGDNPEASVLDPTCGSGTFLFETIRYKKEHTELEGEDLLDHIFENVVGVDVHPLAVIISRTNYLLAAGDLVRDARTGGIRVPIYLSNSIMPPEHDTDPQTDEAVPVYQFDADEAVFKVPAAIDQAEISDLFDSIKRCLDGIEDSGEGPVEEGAYAAIDGEVDGFNSLSEDEKGTIFRSLVQQISDLRSQGRDTIWTFILKNVYKPIYLEDREFDRILGNPPWLSYRYISKESYKDHVKSLILEEYGLLAPDEIQNLSHMELAALVFVYSIENYLRDNGRTSFVMPRGIVSGGQHDRLRKFEGLGGHLRYFWDLEDVSPLFNNLTCVLAAEKSEGESYPLSGLHLSGTLSTPDGGWEDVCEDLTVEERTYYLNEFSNTTMLMDRELDEDAIRAPSPYRERLQSGANVYPRSLWFVDFDELSTPLGINPQEPPVKTSERAIERAEGDRYEDVRISGQIEDDFLFRAITGSELVYFTTLDLPIAVLPVEISGNSYYVHNERSARSNGYQHLAEWISEAERQYDMYKPDDSDGSALDELDRRGKLSEKQDPNAEYRVIQNSSGDYVCGAVITTGNIDEIKVNGTEIDVQRNNDGEIPPIIDHKCYHYETDGRDEAYYLSGFLNSPGIRDLIYDMINRGQFAGRDIHRRVWEVYIPEFNPDDDLHLQIRNKAIEGEQKANDIVPELAEQYQLGWIRRKQRQQMEQLRSELSGLCLRAIEEVNPTQSTLSETSG